MPEDDSFEYRELAKGDRWNLCAAFIYQALVPGVSTVPGSAFEGLYPYGYATDTEPGDDVSVSYTEGWIENSGAIVLNREDHTVRTLRVTDSYGSYPASTAIFGRLATELAA